MSERTRTRNGHDQSEKHSPIYQAALVVRCRHCQKDHRLMITSDDREFAEVETDHLVTALRTANYHPIAALWESYHPGTDLNFRDVEAIDATLDLARYEAPDVR